MKRPLINITVPVLNEANVLESSVASLIRALESSDWSYEVVIADNGSTDQTLGIAHHLANKYPRLRVVHLGIKGRGRALKKAWSESHGDILSYMDVDLSADLKAFPSLIEPLLVGGFDLSVGSRLLKPAMTTRGLKREVISRCYNHLVKFVFHTQFSDAQCGFKAITRQAAMHLLPMVEDNEWFMDTELLVLAERCGFKIYDLPIRWVDDPDSRVQILKTAIADLKGMARLQRLFSGSDFEARVTTELREKYDFGYPN